MSDLPHYIGQRLSLKRQLCTVRYIGAVVDKPGEWLGVEWDEPERGKHDGTHNGVKYFTCRNPAPKAASFLRPNQTWDPPKTFLQALREKYMPEDAGTGGEIVYFSRKQAEEVGFEKFSKRQARLQGIHVLVLDHMSIRFKGEDSEAIRRLCSDINELDLGSNLFESLGEIVELALLFPKLMHLALDGNRFSVPDDRNNATLLELLGLRSLGLSDTLLNWAEIAKVASVAPSLTHLSAARNRLSWVTSDPMPLSVAHIVLSDNDFGALTELNGLESCCRLETLTLKRCHISANGNGGQNPLVYSKSLMVLDIAYNWVADWTFFSSLEEAYPALESLVITGNPLYGRLSSAEGVALTAEDGYMLTIARLPRISFLNYSKITEKVRLNSETYYLNQIATELGRTPADKRSEVLQKHPRWAALCDEYGEPRLQESKPNAINSNSLAARLVTVTFDVSAARALPAAEWKDVVPKSIDVYALFGIAGKRLGVMPLKLRLILETGEHDPVGSNMSFEGPEWWDSSDEEDDRPAADHGFVAREVELVPGTRAIGTYFDGPGAQIRVELKCES
ncbi:hypothetical protein DOTSEDRAFT_19505 [Dothistroma septosporum NZE10]|uniref:CAP-Gly domain-containing protein n=1 Tax=Dothistroma septosporum (strain NZE10 / CBS 128990) TaxID=675120 RepID=N1PZT1_DOTSN|nr:hypothetical protein DOTSEDRAFT_19505 [Dothistroma septosporum NZE10]